MSYTIQSDVLSKAGLTVSQINQLCAGTGLANLGQAFVDAENEYGVNSLFAMSHAAIESAWGNSYLAQNRNALFGLNAYDSNPNGATGYASKYDSVLQYAKFLHDYYLFAGTAHWGGSSSISGVFVHYSTSGQVEAQSIVNIMNYELAKLGSNPTPAPSTGGAGGTTSGNTYTVVADDNLSTIAAAHGLTLAQIEALNPQITNPNLIHAGDIINIGGSAPTPTPAPSAGGRTYVVQANDNLSTIADKFGLSLTQIEALNPQIADPSLIYPGEVVNVGGSTPVPTPAPASSGGTYVTIASGDTLWALSQKYGTPIGQIVDWNQGAHPNITPSYIQAGWSIRVR